MNNKLRTKLSIAAVTLLALSSGLAPIREGLATTHVSTAPLHHTKSIKKQAPPEYDGVATVFFLLLAAWLGLVNTKGVRLWQMKRLIAEVSNLPDTDSEHIQIIPECVAESTIFAANGEEVVISKLRYQAGKHQWVCSLNGKWRHFSFSKADIGIVTISAGANESPRFIKTFFFLGEKSPIWKLASLISFGIEPEITYEQTAEGTWYMLILCPGVKVTLLGTIVPSKGFVIKVGRSGIPSVLSMKKAKREFPSLPAVTGGVAKAYALAYAHFSSGIFNKYVLGATPLEFFQGAFDSLSQPRVVRFVGLGEQWVVSLGRKGGGAVYAILMVSLQDGTPRVYKRPNKTIVTGPTEAINLIRNTPGRSHHRFPSPTLIVRNGEIFWLVCQCSAHNLEDGITLLGHFLVRAGSCEIVPMKNAPRAILDNGLSAISEAISALSSQSSSHPN